jgi:hypothetical protein
MPEIDVELPVAELYEGIDLQPTSTEDEGATSVVT